MYICKDDKLEQDEQIKFNVSSIISHYVCHNIPCPDKQTINIFSYML